MNIIKHRTFIPIVYILAGLFYLFVPFLSSWFAIVTPSIAKNFFLPIDWIVFIATLLLPGELGKYLPDIVFGLATAFYLIYLLKVTREGWMSKQKKLAFAPLVIFPLIWALMIPLGLSYYGMKRVNSFVIGGWSRMVLAGGADRIRTDGYALLNSLNEHPSDDEIPLSIQKLGFWVDIEQDNKILIVGIGRMSNMADEFGYLIYDDKKPLPMPKYLEDSEYYRIWKLADGVYFFEK